MTEQGGPNVIVAWAVVCKDGTLHSLESEEEKAKEVGTDASCGPHKLVRLEGKLE